MKTNATKPVLPGRPSAAWLKKPLFLLPALVAAGLALSAAPALAVRGHVFSGTIGKPGTGAGELSEPAGVAVNEASGVVYVVDKAAGRVEYYAGNIGEMAPLGEFDGSGTLGEGTAAGGGTNPDEEATGKFSEPEGIAVDNSCREHRPVLTGAECAAFDPSDGDVYVLDAFREEALPPGAEHQVVDKYTATGTYVGQITWKTLGLPERLSGRPQYAGDRDVDAVAVARTGQVLVSLNTAGEEPLGNGVFELSNAVVNVKTGFFPTGHGGNKPGLAARPAGGFYTENSKGIEPFVMEFGSAGELLNEEFYAGWTSGLSVESCTGDVYVDENGAGEDRGEGVVVGRFTGSGVLIEELSVPGGRGAHLAVDCVSRAVFVGNAGNGDVDVYGLEPPGEPTVDKGSSAVSSVGSDDAVLVASINPRSDPGDDATAYAFEYGPCPVEGSCAGAGYPESVVGSLVASYEATSASVKVEGLAAGTRYHFRVSARNSHNQAPAAASLGSEVVFTTQSAVALGLLDGRGWELVSLIDKHGADLQGIGETGVVEAAADGSAVTYLATAATEAEAPGNANAVQVFSGRGAGGWGSCDIDLPHEVAPGPSVGFGQEYAAFSRDLGLGLVRPAGKFVPSIAPEASEDTPLLAGLSGVCGGARVFKPLVTAGNVKTGLPFGEEGACPSNLFCGPKFQAANSELSAVVLQSSVPLTEGVPAGGLYEWSGGELLPVSMLPSGAAVGGAVGTQIGQKFSSSRGAVSGDGSRVVWSAGGRLFVWDRALGFSIRVDKAASGVTVAGREESLFQYMTPDGDHVFFTDTQRLTTNSGAATSNPDLYECTVVTEGEGEPHCALNDLTPANGGEAAGVQGLVFGGSDDGGRVYFVANGTLGSGPSASGEQPVKGNCGTSSGVEECNLFVSDEGRVSLVAVLSGDDAGDWGSASAATLQKLTGSVSDDGEWLVFMSDRELTGYDNHDVVSGRSDEEVYEYRVGSGVVCVSCDPSGLLPSGVEYGKLNNDVAGGDRVWPLGQWIAASVPGWTPFRLEEAQYQPRYLSQSGRVFFNSSDGLVPSDHNGTEDVYEYEPPEVGSCTTTSASYSSTSQGCIGLVSSATSGEESGFLDASESGDDVFFLTAAQLSHRDTDTSLDVYDARVDAAPEAEPARPVECAGDACQTPVAPPEDLTPGSLTYHGSGNPLVSPAPGPAVIPKAKPETKAQKLTKALGACHRERAKARRKSCEKTARRKFGPVGKSKSKSVKQGGR
jgi:hypothetical protein